MQLLHSKETPAFTETVANGRNGSGDEKPRVVKIGGRTLDLTLFTVTRALDVIVGELWSRHSTRRKGAQKWTKVKLLETL